MNFPFDRPVAFEEQNQILQTVNFVLCGSEYHVEALHFPLSMIGCHTHFYFNPVDYYQPWFWSQKRLIKGLSNIPFDDCSVVGGYVSPQRYVITLGWCEGYELLMLRTFRAGSCKSEIYGMDVVCGI